LQYKEFYVSKALLFITALVFITTGVLIILRFNPFSKIPLLHTGELFNRDRIEKVYVDTYPDATLNQLWDAYKREYVQKDGRTMDRAQNFLTTSEGQSYTLLRSVWLDDKETFDATLLWTNHNLKKRGDNLFAWKWGELSPGNWGVLESEGGLNSASDADQDIALALIFAYHRWNQPHYLEQARRILNDIWEQEVIIIQDKPYMTAGNWAKLEAEPIINPSYLSPAAYSIFSKVDPIHDWMAVKDTSYEILEKSTVVLPPDWIKINPATLEVIPHSFSDEEPAFSHDALRVFWRVGLDWEWHQERRAKEYFTKVSFLKAEWDEYGAIRSAYTLDGKPLVSDESLSMYGAVLPYFLVISPEIAGQIYNDKLAEQFNPDSEDFHGDIGYYSSNWAWFGMAMYQDRLLNLFSSEGVRR